jgi:hypothetical protein
MLVMWIVSVLFVAQPGTVQSFAEKLPTDYVLIEGKKDPSSIPEWLAWQEGFVILAEWHDKDSGFNHDLRESLSAVEFDLFEHEALLQSERQAALEKAFQPLMDAYKNRDPNDQKELDRLQEQLHELNLKYRRSVLAARDRVLEGIRPESQAVVVAWVGEMRTAISAKVPKSELAKWRAPE